MKNIFPLKFKGLIIALLSCLLVNPLMATEQCHKNSYELRNLFPVEWIDDFCSKHLCGRAKYTRMISDYHNIFTYEFLSSITDEPESMAANQINPVIKKINPSENNANQIDTFVQRMHSSLSSNILTNLNSQAESIIEEENKYEDNFLCRLTLNTRNDLFRGTKGRARGILARTILYMIDQYNIKDVAGLLNQDIQLLKSWNVLHPPKGRECSRNYFIEKKQGNDNKFITKGCSI